MSIEFYCTSCSKQLRVADDKAGKRCKCPSCQTTLLIPSPAPTPETFRPDREQWSSVAEKEVFDVKIEIGCPKCQTLLLYGPELEGTRGLCKACGHIFTLSQNAAGSIEQNSFPFQCPSCQFLFEGKTGMEGRKGKCTECGGVFEIKPMETAISVPTTVETSSTKVSDKGPISPSQKPSSVHEDDLDLQPLRPTSSTKNPVMPVAKPILPVAKPISSAAVSTIPIAKPISASSAAPLPSHSSSLPQPTLTRPVIPASPQTASNPNSRPGWETLEIPAATWSAPTASNQGANPYAATTSSGPQMPRYETHISRENHLTWQYYVVGASYILLGFLGMLVGLYFCFFAVLGFFFGNTPAIQDDSQRIGFQVGRFLAMFAFLMIPLIQIILIIAGVCMIRLRARKFAIAASILAVIPIISPICVMGIPSGIWGLVILFQSDAKRLFR